MRLLRGEKRAVPTARAAVEAVIWHGEIKLVTPLLGGGHTSGQVDVSRPIRASAIRGHLRFWWRATHGVLLPSIEEMRQREDLIFGAPARKRNGKNEGGRGLVVVQVADGQCDPPTSLWRDEKGDKECPGFAKNVLLQDMKIRQQVKDDRNFNPAPVIARNAHAKCKVILNHAAEIGSEERSQIEKELKLAVAAWLMYGGYGARSRRGFGVLDYAQSRILLPTGAARSDTPSLHGARLWVENYDSKNVYEAWRRAVTVYQLIRKGVTVGHDGEFGARYRAEPEGKDAKRLLGKGQSYLHVSWPERSWIQAVERQRPDFENRESDAPRAQFGLPFHVKCNDNHSNTPRGEYDVKPHDSDRFASPIVIKPVKVNGAWRAAILVLNVEPLKPAEVGLYAKQKWIANADSVDIVARDGSFRDYDWEDEILQEKIPKLGHADITEEVYDQVKQAFEKLPEAARHGYKTLEGWLDAQPLPKVAYENLSVAKYVSQVLKRADIGWKEHKL